MPAASTFLPQWKRRKRTVNAGATVTVFQRTLSTFRTLKLVVSVSNLAQDKSRIFEFSVVNSDDKIDDNLFGKIGDEPAIEFNAIKSGSDVKIECKNNEAFTIGVNYIFAVFKTVT